MVWDLEIQLNLLDTCIIQNQVYKQKWPFGIQFEDVDVSLT